MKEEIIISEENIAEAQKLLEEFERDKVLCPDAFTISDEDDRKFRAIFTEYFDQPFRYRCKRTLEKILLLRRR